MDTWYNRYAVIVLVAIAGVGAYEWVNWCELKSADWAAWVQAVGSIGTIAGAFYLARVGIRQARQEEKIKEMAAFEKQMDVLLSLAYKAKELVEHAWKYRKGETSQKPSLSDTSTYRAREIISLTNVHEMLSAFDVQRIPDFNVAFQIIEMRQIVKRTIEEIKALDGDYFCSEDRFLDNFESLAAHVELVYREIGKARAAVIEENVELANFIS
ncbi:hypothetical protein [Noviherbaspirillum humi]|uniref:hypothetical protein n=1 Tax=Noviherbaspirillum humi TaxID=1688639 RepID=UPI000B797485|nr:hypothetical protein [Noviherbaspirillum humi]